MEFNIVKTTFRCQWVKGLELQSFKVDIRHLWNIFKTFYVPILNIRAVWDLSRVISKYKTL